MKTFASLIAIAAIASFSTFAVAQDAPQCSQCPSQAAAVATSTQEEAPQCSQCPSQAAAVATSTQEGQCEGSCGSTTATAIAQDEECEGCPVAAAMAALPKMTYKVGEEMTCCGESAAALAEEHSAPIHFVVADNVYETKEEAYTALVTSTEEMVNAFVTPATCETSGCTTIAGKACQCPVEASQRSELVATAISEINMEYKVGEESACCAGSAAAMAEKSGEAINYVVAGEATCCEMTARLALAHARYQAAVQATLAAAPEAAEATETEAVGSDS